MWDRARWRSADILDVVPSFCRHNRLIQNCPICSREQDIEARPVVSSSAPRVSQPRPSTASPRRRAGSTPARSRGGDGVRVRRLARGADDGYRSSLVPGLRSSQDAQRLADEIAFAATRLNVLEHTPPGAYAQVADAAGDVEERTWLAFLIAYLAPLEDDEPFAEIERVRTPWASGELPRLDDVRTGPRSAHAPERGTQTLAAYRAWADRFRSQSAALTGESAWTAERRFERAFERLALPGLHRDGRYALLVSLGRLGVYELRAGSLRFGGDNETTVAAKRALGIGDPLLLDRRALDLASACGVALEALDLALFNWGTDEHLSAGVPVESDPGLLASVQAALGLD
jgi:hypothetical protein